MYRCETYRGINYYPIDNDVNGNGRAVVWFGDVPFRDKLPGENWDAYHSARFAHACNALNGKRYRGKWFGGGVVSQSSHLHYYIDRMLDA